MSVVSDIQGHSNEKVLHAHQQGDDLPGSFSPDLIPSNVNPVPPELERAVRRLQFPPSYVIVGIYRLVTDKSLSRPAWDKCKHGTQRGLTVGFAWVCAVFVFHSCLGFNCCPNRRVWPSTHSENSSNCFSSSKSNTTSFLDFERLTAFSVLPGSPAYLMTHSSGTKFHSVSQHVSPLTHILHMYLTALISHRRSGDISWLPSHINPQLLSPSQHTHRTRTCLGTNSCFSR
jgi:hypothetical protein